jgi:putative transposase
MDLALALTPTVGVVPLCRALSIPRASLYRHARPDATTQEALSPAEPGRASPRALRSDERQAILDVLHAPRFQDRSPTEAYATLLDEGVYLASERTFYRLLAAAGETAERRDQLVHPTYHKPELLATRPNEVWTWDITKLLGPTKWTSFCLDVIIDIFSRGPKGTPVGWLVAHQELATLAERLIADTLAKQGIAANQLTIPMDRGSAMTSKPVALLLADLGVAKTHSRPHVSNDNPFSESQFKTLKYRPEFPDRFTGIEHARSFGHDLIHWYNTEHRHTGIGLMTPEAVHYGRADALYAARALVLRQAYTAHPERFVNQIPMPPPLPTAAWINPPAPIKTEEVSQ